MEENYNSSRLLHRFFCSVPAEAAGPLTSAIKLTQDRNMPVIVICIHWLQRGRHELSSDLCCNGSQIHIYSIQPHSTTVLLYFFPLHNFYRQKRVRAKNSNEATQNV